MVQKQIIPLFLCNRMSRRVLLRFDAKDVRCAEKRPGEKNGCKIAIQRNGKEGVVDDQADRSGQA